MHEIQGFIIREMKKLFEPKRQYQKLYAKYIMRCLKDLNQWIININNVRRAPTGRR